MIKILLAVLALACGTQASGHNAVDLGLVSEAYPLEFWDSLSNLTDKELNPNFLRFLLFIDRTRAGDAS